MITSLKCVFFLEKKVISGLILIRIFKNFPQTVFIFSMLFYPSSWTASDKVIGGKAPDTPHITPEDHKSMPRYTVSCAGYESGKFCELYSKPVIYIYCQYILSSVLICNK